MRVVKDGETPPPSKSSSSPPPRRQQGPVERATRRSLRALKAGGADQAVYDALAAGAVVLAQTLDDGAGLAAAAVHRELRTTLDSLRPREAGVDRELAALLDDLGSGAKGSPAPPVGHEAD